MRFFLNLSISRKLTLVIVLTSAIALLLAFAASVSYELVRFRSSIVRDLSTQAEITGANCAAALAFNDTAAAHETLSLLGARKGILAARVYRADGTVLAEYLQEGVTLPPLPIAGQIDSHYFKSGYVVVCRRVTFGKDDVGAVSVHADLHEQQASLEAYAWISLGVMLALLIVALFLSTWMQRFVSEPIMALARVARAVSGRKDYSLRAAKQGDDEIGFLAEGFNQMLAEIERHDAELRASEERFRQIAENIRGVFWMKDMATERILYVSPAYEKLWGRSCASLYESPGEWGELIHPEDKERVSAAINRKEEGRFDEEYRITRRDGSMRWIRDRGFPIRNAKGEIYRMAGIAEDITERKQAEAELREKELRLRAVVDRAPIIVFAVNKDGLITTEEGHALHDVGIAPGANVGQHMAEVFSDNPRLIENINRSLFGEEFTETVEFAGQVFSTWHAPQMDARGNITGMVGVATNVTERFQLERQVLEISDREQARIGQDLHDGLCQHLVGLAFAANTLEESLAARGADEMTAAHEIAAMLDEAITQARNTAHGLYPARLEEEGLVSALGELATHVSARHGVNCRMEYPGPVLLADNAATIQLYRIAQEAVTNAIKHAHPQQVVISLTSSAGKVNLSVVDDGAGFIEPSRAGRGMGLNIMKYRARTIGGIVHVRRHSKGGTEVLCSVAEKSTGVRLQTTNGGRHDN